MTENGAKPLNVISLFGEDIRLVRPKGLAGLRFISKAQLVLKRVLEALEPFQAKIGKKSTTELVVTSETLGLMSELLDEEFINEILPAFYMHSTAGMSKDEAMAHIETKEISTEAIAGIFEAFTDAMNFWGVAEDPEALDAAQKKSGDAKGNRRESSN